MPNKVAFRYINSREEKARIPVIPELALIPQINNKGKP